MVSEDANVPTRDGLTLLATVNQPKTGSGWPVVILPGTFAGDTVNINRIAAGLAGRGYVAVSYLERGFGKSGGFIDAGGPLDVADVSDVLTWVLANTTGDAKRVGLASISYGAGFGPIVAVMDHRFTAVAMVSGWGDMWRARYPNNTSALASNVALGALAEFSGRPSPGVIDFFTNAIKNVYTDDMKQLAAERSPVTYLDRMRANPVPLYVSTSMNESIWPADQTIDFFNAYPGPKHLDILPGDHATTELGTPIGLPGVTWNTAFDWLDAYVAGTSTAAKALPLVRVVARSPQGANFLQSGLASTFDFESYAGTANRTTRRVYLTTSSSMFGLVTRTQLGSSAGTAAKQLREGQNLLLQNGIPMVQGGFEIVFGTPTTVPLNAVDQGVTGLWTGPALASKLSIRGSTRVHLDLTPSAARGSVFVYLLERAPNDGTTYVIGHKPYSWTGLKPGVAVPLDVTIPYNAYDVPAGHALIVGVSTGDVLYTSNNPAGSSISIGPRSYVDLPLR